MRKYRTIKYPVVYWEYRKKVDASGLSQRDFCLKYIGVNYTTVNSGLTGQNDISKKVIDGLLRITGLTYEEAFKNVGDDFGSGSGHVPGAEEAVE